MKGQFATVGAFRLLFLVYFVYILCRHPIRKKMYFTLGFAALCVGFCVLHVLYDQKWMITAMTGAWVVSWIVSLFEERKKHREEKE